MVDATRPAEGDSISHPVVVARCVGCELVVEVDVLGASVGDQLADCGECGSPVYVIDPTNALFVAGFGAGWDACAAFMSSVIDGERDHDDLVPSVAAMVDAGSARAGGR